MNKGMIDVTKQPIWSPWVVIDVQNTDGIPAGRAVRIGSGMTKNDAMSAARAEGEKRPDVVAITARRDGEQF